MKLEIVIDGKTRALEIEEQARNGGTCRFVFGAKSGTADVCEVEPGVYSILIDGCSYEVKIESGVEGYFAGVNGRRYAIQVRDPRRLSRTGGEFQAAGRQKIASPMPGKVLRVLVKEGEEVAAGQGLLVVEAMKMQNDIRSPKAGRVAAIRAVEGATVAGGETLAEVE